MLVVKAGSRPPWIGLAAAVWVQIAAGNGGNFILYSAALKSVTGYSQQQLTLLGVANDIGESSGLLPGLLCNRLPPWLILLVGASACSVGYGVVWLAVSETLVLPYWLLWIALCIATSSCAWLSTGVLVTNMRNFPLSRGIVAGILKGYGGLSAAVFTELYTGVLHKSSTKLLLFLALGLPAICLVLMFFVRPCTPASDEDSSEHNDHFLFTQILSFLLALYLLGTTIASDVLSVSESVACTFFGVMVLLLLAPLAIPIKMTLYPTRPKRPGTVEPSSSQEQLAPMLERSQSSTNLGSLQEKEDDTDANVLLAEGEGAVLVPGKKRRRPKRGEDFNFKQAVAKADFWLLFLINFLGCGSGITVLNNLAQVGTAAGEDDTTTLLCLLSFCSFVGRLGGGLVSEYFVRSRMLPRSIWMALSQAAMIAVYLLYASQLYGTLYASTALLGICYGVQYSVMVPTASELFGLKHFGKIYNFMALGNPIGALLFSVLLAGYVYDKEAAKQQSGKEGACYGPDCFRLTFLVLAGLNGAGCVLGAVLTLRVRPVYRMLYSSGSFKLPQRSPH